MPNDIQKSTFFLSKTGKRIKKISDGITNQKIPCDSSAILSVSFVSIYIQTKASNDTSGIDAKILPIVVLRFDISEMATSVTDDSSILIM